MPPNKQTLRVIKQKIEKIKNLEENYWENINEQREKIALIDEAFKHKYEDIFPKDQSTLIYGCIDGAVLIRHSEGEQKNLVEVRVFDFWLEKLLKELPIPYKNGQMLNLSAIAKLVPGSFMKIGRMKLSEALELSNLQVSVFKYSDEEKIISLQDALTDIRLAILGYNADIQRENQTSSQKEKQSILNRLSLLKNEFDRLLNTAEREEELQIFLKSHPILIQPYSNIFPKKKLGEDFITDFVFASTLDQGIKYTFVEIEKPSMPVFTKDGEFTYEFNHSQNQTLQWELWLEYNIDYLRRGKLPDLERPNFLIIGGRSSKFDNDNRALLRAWNRRQLNTEFLTYDDITVKLEELINNLKKEEGNIE